MISLFIILISILVFGMFLKNSSIYKKKKSYSFDTTFVIYSFYSQYNNNYRPIYHLERLFINLINEHQKIMCYS